MPFLFVIQAVHTNILKWTRCRIIIKHVDDILHRWHKPPCRGVHWVQVIWRGQAVLKGLATIAQYILRDIAQVEIEVATAMIVLVVIEVGIHHPELDELDIVLFEIRRIDGAHDAAPT